MPFFEDLNRVPVWKTRSTSGPFAQRGDTSGPNSLGQWAEAAQAAPPFPLFRSPTQWGGVSSSGCVTINRDAIGTAPDPELRAAKRVADVAFTALVRRNEGAMNSVARYLVAQTNYSDTRFGNTQRWCGSGPNIGGHDGLGHTLGAMGGFWIVAYDFVTAAESLWSERLLNDAERSAFASWCTALGVWLRSRNDALQAGAGSSIPSFSRPVYPGGPRPAQTAIRFSNKFTMRARAYGLIGIKFSNQPLIDAGVSFAQRFIRNAFFPGGAVSDFHRGGSSGWKYSATQVGCLTHLAAASLQAGDRRIIDYATSEGVNGTSGNHHTGGPKTLQKMVADMCRYIPGTPSAFTSRIAAGINPGDRIEDMGIAHALKLWSTDTVITSGLLRRGRGWPARPALGKHGDRGLLTASLLMHSN